MLYIRWTEQDIAELSAFSEITILYTEINDEGEVLKEIGLNNEGKIIHKSPSTGYPYGEYGIFDNQKVAISGRKSNFSKDEFYQLWESE